MKNKLVEFRKNNREEGLSLIEILVAIILLSVVSLIVISLINTTMNSASRFSNVTASQAEVSTAASTLQRDISTANQVAKATTSSLTVKVRADSKDYEVTYFLYTPQGTPNPPVGANVNTLPQSGSSLVQLRREVNSTNYVQKVLVQGINTEDFAGTDMQNLFTYYGEDNTEVTVPDLSSGSSASSGTVAKIKRVEFRINANAAGRGTPIQIASSAVINSSTVSPSTVGGPSDPYAGDGIPQCVAQFTVAIDPASAPRTAVLSWYPSAGATSYTVYRQDVTTGAATTSPVTTIVADPADRELIQTQDDGITFGRTYIWSMQVNGPGGTTGVCTTTQGTIVPDQIQFANINSLAQLNATKNGTGAETLTRAAEQNIGAVSRTTSGEIVSGSRYTVARDLTNQLSWEVGVTGTTGYKVYEPNNLNTPVATITSAGTTFTQIPSNYGAVRNYLVRAYNAGGEGEVSGTIQLVSPPTASSFTAVDPDTSVRSTTTDTNLSLTQRAANTTGYRAYKNEAAAAASTNMCAPTTWAASPTLNFVSNTPVNDGNAAWGTNGCYRFVPFNDAGNGVAATSTVLHKPGKFTFTNVSNPSTMRVIDTNRDLNGNWGPGLGLPYCWSDINGNAGSLEGDWNCKADSKSVRGDAYSPIGMFGTISNSRLSIYVSWGQSYNAYNDYTIRRERLASGNMVDQNAATVQTHNVPYVSGGQAIKYNNEQPGSIFQFTVTGTAPNGLTRARTTQTLTRPDIPASMMGNYWNRANLDGGRRGTKTVVQANLSASHGMIDSLRFVSDFPGAWGGTTESWVAANGSTVGLSSNYQTTPGKNYRGLSTYVTRTISVNDTGAGDSNRTINVTQQSDEIGRFGQLTGFGCPSGGSGSCYSGDGASYPWGWPTWWTGGPARYWAGGEAVSGWIEIGNQNGVEAPPFTAGGGSDVSTCQSTTENANGFTNNCTYGTGIPPAPTVSITQSGTTQTATWNSWNAVTQYRVTYSVNNGAETTVTKQASDRSLAVTVPVGQQIRVSVVAINAVNESEAGTSMGVTAPAAPNNVTVTAGSNNTSLQVSWDSVSGATGYTVYYSKDGGATQTVAGNSNPLTISNLTAGTYTVRVAASAGGSTGPQSVARVVSLGTTSAGSPAAPTVVSAAPTPGFTGRVDIFVMGPADVTYDVLMTGANNGTRQNQACAPAGDGCLISLSNLSAGYTTFSLRARNSSGATSSYVNSNGVYVN